MKKIQKDEIPEENNKKKTKKITTQDVNKETKTIEKQPPLKMLEEIGEIKEGNEEKKTKKLDEISKEKVENILKKAKQNGK